MSIAVSQAFRTARPAPHRSALTRVRLLVVLVAISVVTVPVFLLAQPGASAQAPEPPATTTVTVEEGQSLWSIARTHSGGQRTDIVVEDIKRLNGLRDSAIRAGQSLQVPAR
jgi:LysM repeat protein